MSMKIESKHRRQRSRIKPWKKALVFAAVLFFSIPVLAMIGGAAFLSRAPSTAQTSTKTPVANAQSEASAKPTEKSVEDTFSSYDSDRYDKSTNTYSFKYADYGSLFDNDLSDSGNGLRSGTITRNGETWNVYCYQYSNSCSVSTSSGNYGNVYCYKYSNTCDYSDSAGSRSSTYCYTYSNSCSTSHSDGSYSNTYCYQYSNSCTTNNSDGSTTNTYCYTYSSSCDSTTTGGSSSYNYSRSTYDYSDY